MKKVLFIIILLLSLIHSTVKAQDVVISYQSFYDDLSPYGQWISDSQYGYVWIPNVDDDFRPYFTGGHWVMTEFGNTWVSDYPWGWACFHYGRWIYNDFYGWLWVPGYEWGPGWVAWRWGNGLCGWAPLYPGVMWTGLIYTCPEDWWIFIHPRHLYQNAYRNHWRKDFFYGPHHTHMLIHRTQFITNVYEHNTGRFYSGPRATEVQQVIHRPVQVYSYGNTNTRGSERIESNMIFTYRPKIDHSNINACTPAPRQLIQAPKQITSPGELNNNWNQPRQFKLDQQRQNTRWNRPFIRNAPPYDPNLTHIKRSNPMPSSIRPHNQIFKNVKPDGGHFIRSKVKPAITPRK